MTQFTPIFHFYTPFSGGVKVEDWREIVNPDGYSLDVQVCSQNLYITKVVISFTQVENSFALNGNQVSFD